MKAAILNYLSKKRYLLPLSIILLTIVTLTLTLIPLNKYVPSTIWSYDKIGHLVIFGTWTYLLGLYQLIKNPGNFSMFTIFIIGVSFGITIEILQYLLPLNRSAELFDIAFDSLGSFLAVVLLYKSRPNLSQDDIPKQHS